MVAKCDFFMQWSSFWTARLGAIVKQTQASSIYFATDYRQIVCDALPFHFRLIWSDIENAIILLVIEINGKEKHKSVQERL